MVTCPWCGTTYTGFQSNCDKCGGPMPPPMQAPTPNVDPYSLRLPKPPPAPRPFADRYAWTLMFTDGSAVVSLVFTILGAVFTLVGFVTTIAIITAFIGLPFLLLGVALLIGGLAMMRSRLAKARETVEVLKVGESTEGQITGLEENYNVRINGRNPWTIRYMFQAGGQNYTGQVNTLNMPGPLLQPGQPTWVLYLPNTPEKNVLYPHP